MMPNTPGPAGPRIITQAGPGVTWEWLMVDETKAYASLFPDEIRARVRAALESTRRTDGVEAPRERAPRGHHGLRPTASSR